MRRVLVVLLSLLTVAIYAQPCYDYKNIQREKLNRGVVAIPTKDGDSTCVLWRFLEEDSLETSFNVYRNGKKINDVPIYNTTFFKDKRVDGESVRYEVRTVDAGKESHRKDGEFVLLKQAPSEYLSIKLDKPIGVNVGLDRTFFYEANDCSVGDVDGDGEYEIFLKWQPSNAKDNAHDGFTGNTIIDCYKLNGLRLWRIYLGKNIRSGAHYTPFLVYDFDGDGKAELVMRTSDGTVDGEGTVIGDANADYRNNVGRILEGKEYLTVFEGMTGKALCSIDYVPERGNVAAWGDIRANRSDRFLACVAYLDGVHPSIVMCRGYYTRTVLAAFDWDGSVLKEHWIFDSDNMPGHEGAGQGFHSVRVADVDEDGKDEIVYGSMCVDHNGKLLYNTHLGHGDALHLTAFFPDSKALQLWSVHEEKPCSELHDARTGNVIFKIDANDDVGRGMAADINPEEWGVEMWSVASDGVRNVKGNKTKTGCRIPSNSAVWWDGDLLRELLDNVRVSKYDWINDQCVTIADFSDKCASNNGTKRNVCLSADIFGDWREEIIVRTFDNNELRIYSTTIPTNYRFHTFMQDIPYRLSVATENVGYNQPPELGEYFGTDMKKGSVFRGWKF